MENGANVDGIEPSINKSNITELAAKQNIFLQLEETLITIWRMIHNILLSGKSIAELLLEITFSYNEGNELTTLEQQAELCNSKIKLILEKICVQEENLILFGKIFENLPNILTGMLSTYMNNMFQMKSLKLGDYLKKSMTKSMKGGSGTINIKDLLNTSLNSTGESLVEKGMSEATGIIDNAGKTVLNNSINFLRNTLETINPIKPILDIIKEQLVKIKNEILGTLGISDPCKNPVNFSKELCKNIVKLNKLDIIKLLKLYSTLVLKYEDFWSKLKPFFNLKFFDNFLVDSSGKGQLGDKIEKIRQTFSNITGLIQENYDAADQTVKSLGKMAKEIELETVKLIDGGNESLKYGGYPNRKEIKIDLDKKINTLMKNYLKGGGVNMYSFIFDPETGIQYSIYSETGSFILQNYKKRINN